jgi:sec-independent protein translocase protein TatA
MGGLSLTHLLIIGAVLLLVFGGKKFKFSDMMSDVAKGIKSFKKGLAEDDQPEPPPTAAEPARTIEHQVQTQSPAALDASRDKPRVG